MHIRAGTRPSRLALLQVDEIKKRFPEIDFEVVPLVTEGDKDKHTPLVFKEGSNFFTYEIEQALINKEIDVAIHSAKDLAEDMPSELMIAALTKSISIFDCLVSRDRLTLAGLPRKARIGTSSKNRSAGIKGYRPDLEPAAIRGNIEERLRKLDEGEYEAIIVAHAALLRLGLTERITEIIPLAIIEPHPLQGRLAIQARRDRYELIELFKVIDGQ